MKDRRKIYTVQTLKVFLFFVLLLGSVGVSFGWLSYWHQLNTISVVQIPSRITISGANRSEMLRIPLEMSSDDTQNGNTVTIRRVFCIESTDDYYLEVAHTTNIMNMDIKIYPVSNANSDVNTGNVKGYDAGKVFYYNPDADPLEGDYINKDGSIAIQKESQGSLHDQVYADGDSVQQNAEPVYWLTRSLEKYDKSGYSREGIAADGKTEIHYRYYVLQLSWDIAQSETDMIYLLASHQE